MKILLKNTIIAFIACGFAIPSFAADSGYSALLNTQDTIKDVSVLLPADEVTYTKTEVSAVPVAVTHAVAVKYDGYIILEAYKGSDNSYKLILEKADVHLTVYYNEAGEFQKEDYPAGLDPNMCL